MPSKMNNKNKMYDFEKIAFVIALVITVTIVLLVVFATSGSGRPSPSNSSAVADTSVDQSGESGGHDSTEQPSTVIQDTQIEFKTITVNNTTLSEGDLILVNQEHEYSTNIDDKLTNLYTYNSAFKTKDVRQYLRTEILDRLKSMYDDYHAALENAYVMISDTYVGADTKSEHSTGLALDLSSANDNGSWFIDNCWRYGFVLRYPEGKESVTNVNDENNHYRYVGVPHALYMKLNKLVLEEYLGLLETKTSTSRLRLDDGTSDRYEAYAVKAQTGAQTEIKVPDDSSGWLYKISGTNNGYFVVTIYKIEG